MKESRLKPPSSGKPMRLLRNLMIIVLAALAVIAGAAGFLLFEGEQPEIALQKEIRYLGKQTEIPFSVTDRKRGLRSIVVTVSQNGEEQELLTQNFDRQSWLGEAGPAQTENKAVFDLARTKLKEGQAEIVITARDFSLAGTFKGNAAVERLAVEVDTKAPRIGLQHFQRYIRPGGSGIVVYDLSEPAQKHGAMIDDLFFPGFALNGKENRFIAYIALPWNSKGVQNSRVVASDQAGNEGTAAFTMVFKNVREKSDSINISDNFLNSKIPEFEEHYPEMTGSQTDKYLFVNNEVRNRNAATIMELCGTPVAEQLWRDMFTRMPGQTMAGYAEERSYFYQGKEIDHQVHLGIDIASTANAPIKAANRGKVVFADYLGIYGNMVLIDHGQGVFSLYSHLSRLDTTVGAEVDQNTVIAYSGATGMAGGDHLHFSMLIHGMFVTPIEWWDQHWIDVNIKEIVSQL
ncbi:MAG: M23 family metallopeptidase [Desulfobulbus sp.]|nr:MAG: M23 family metallopeptidase [Desulfobulbus sp.]